MTEEQSFDKVSLLRLAFKGLEESELQEMAPLMELHTYPLNHVLCHEGAFEDVFYIIAEGQVEITKKLIDGQDEQLLRLGGKGDMVGEMALIQNAPRAATVRTVTECTVLEMEKSDFETILSHSPRMAIDIVRITLDRIRANDQKMIADLQRTNQILRQLDRNKMEFIQVAGHELRTPLTILKGYVKMLGSFPVIMENATLGNVMGGILKGVDRMHGVVNLMLDVTRIDADTMKPAIVPVPLKRLINDLVHDFEKTSERPILIATKHAEEELTLHGDPTLIHKALYQLLVNAIKYTPDGRRVIITTRPVVMEHNVSGVEIAVRDSGIGLDAEHHELVFEKFYQVGSVDLHSSGKTTFKGGGPGLGLAIVRGVARAHGGKTWVESAGHDEVNFTGSTFYLQLPVDPTR
jgi:signal transduction histidine kinase